MEVLPVPVHIGRFHLVMARLPFWCCLVQLRNRQTGQRQGECSRFAALTNYSLLHADFTETASKNKEDTNSSTGTITDGHAGVNKELHQASPRKRYKGIRRSFPRNASYL